MFLGSKGSPGSSKIQGTALAVWIPLRQRIWPSLQKDHTNHGKPPGYCRFAESCATDPWILVMSIHWGWYSASNYEIEGYGGDQWSMILFEMWVSPSVDMFMFINQSASLLDFHLVFLYIQSLILLEFASSNCIVTGYVDEWHFIRLAVWGGKIVWMTFGDLLLKRKHNNVSSISKHISSFF